MKQKRLKQWLEGFVIFPAKGKLIETDQCPLCGAVIRGAPDFRDALSRREYGISGMCQACQDMIADQKDPYPSDRFDDDEEVGEDYKGK